MERERLFFVLALIVAITALIIQILAVSLPFWQWNAIYEYVNANTTRLTHNQVQGLWTACDLQDGFSSCWELYQSQTMLGVVAALETTSTILLLLIVILMIVYLACLFKNIIFHVVAIIILCVCAILILTGIILYGVHINDSSLHFAFAFAFLAAILSLIAAALLNISICKGRSHVNKISTIESRENQGDSDNEGDKREDNTVVETATVSQIREVTPIKTTCGECGRSQGTVVTDRSTSMIWVGSVHPTVTKGPDTATRSTCMTPLKEVAGQFRHRTFPVYCNKSVPKSSFACDEGLHGPCPNSLLCCRCQHKVVKSRSCSLCHTFMKDSDICEKCKDEQNQKDKTSHKQDYDSTKETPRPVIHGGGATTKMYYGRQHQVSDSSKLEKANSSKVSSPPPTNRSSRATERKDKLSYVDNDDRNNGKETHETQATDKVHHVKNNEELPPVTTRNLNQTNDENEIKSKQTDNKSTNSTPPDVGQSYYISAPTNEKDTDKQPSQDQVSPHKKMATPTETTEKTPTETTEKNIDQPSSQGKTSPSKMTAIPKETAALGIDKQSNQDQASPSKVMETTTETNRKDINSPSTKTAIPTETAVKDTDKQPSQDKSYPSKEMEIPKETALTDTDTQSNQDQASPSKRMTNTTETNRKDMNSPSKKTAIPKETAVKDTDKQPSQDKANPSEKTTKARKPVRSRYAFDRTSGTLPNYSPNDADDNNEGEGRSTTGSSVQRSSKRRNPPKKWERSKWN